MWFTEEAWPPIFVGIAGILLLISAWSRNRRTWCLYAAAAMALACVGVYFFEHWYVTEPEVVEAEVPRLVKAVEEDDVKKVLAFFSDDATLLRGKVEIGMAKYTIGERIRLTDLRARYGEDKSTVITHFRANGYGSQKSAAGISQPLPTRWELTWKKFGDRWKITHIQRLHLTADEKLELLAPP